MTKICSRFLAVLLAAIVWPGAAAIAQQPSPDTYTAVRISLARATGLAPAPVDAAFVTQAFFRGVTPLVGRFFNEQDFQPPVATNVVVISHRLWVEAFESSPSAVGAPIEVGGRPATIVGVAPREFEPEKTGRLWLPRVPGPAAGLALPSPPPGVTVATTAARRVAVRPGDPRDFVPLVKETSEEGRCEVLPASAFPEGQHGLSLVYGAPQVRRITLIFDQESRPLRYSDARGDLRYSPTGVPQGPRTTITIDFQRDSAVMQNEGPGITEEGLRGSALIARNAENLGPPEKYIKRITTECGKLLEKR